MQKGYFSPKANEYELSGLDIDKKITSQHNRLLINENDKGMNLKGNIKGNTKIPLQKIFSHHAANQNCYPD